MPRAKYTMLANAFHRFFNALGFYTRLPCPKSVQFNAEHLNRASAFFPLMGIIVALLVYFVYASANMVFSHELSILLSMIASLLITGAFHEDGFADLCDGFGGGWNPEDILRIMKDSRLGTYGVAGLVLILLLKWQSLTHISPASMCMVLIVAHSLSRAWALSLMMVLPYVQTDKDSKAKPIAQAWHKSDMILAWVSALIPLAYFAYAQQSLELFTSLMVIGAIHWYWIQAWFRHRLNGYTGDALGAAQQIQEVTIYLAAAAYFAL